MVSSIRPAPAEINSDQETTKVAITADQIQRIISIYNELYVDGRKSPEFQGEYRQKPAPRGDEGSQLLKDATKVVGAALGKLLADEMVSAIGTTANKHPIEKAVTGLAMATVIAAMVLQRKKPRLAEFMTKFAALWLCLTLAYRMALPLLG